MPGRKIAVVGIQPPTTVMEGMPASRRNTSPPFSALVLTESLRKQAESRGDAEVLLIALRGPRGDRGEKEFETLVVNASDGKVLLHDNLPAEKEVSRFFDGEITVERTTVDLKRLAEMVKDIGTDSVAVSSPWTSGLCDIAELRKLIPSRRLVMGGSGLFPGFAKMLSHHDDTFVVLGPGFGENGIDQRLYELLRDGKPSAPDMIYSGGRGAVLQLVGADESQVALSALRKLSSKGQAHENYLNLNRAYRASGNSLFPYLGGNMAGGELVDMLSRFEFTEGDHSLLETAPLVYLYLTYGCPHTCEYCTSPVMRRGQTKMSEDGVEKLVQSLVRILNDKMRLRITIWDENPRPRDILKFFDRFSQIASTTLGERKERSFQVEFTDGFYPKLWLERIGELRDGAGRFRERMGALGVAVKIGAYFPAENWGYGDVKFYENKSETYDALNEGSLRDVLSLFDYIGTCAGMDGTLAEEAAFNRYLAYLKRGWGTFRDALGENCALAPFFTQVFPGTALSLTPFHIFGERINPEMLEDDKAAMQIAKLYAFGENFASPAFQCRSPSEFRTLLDRFYAIWEELNGHESASLRRMYGATVNPAVARLLFSK
ncbi:MAG: hypothetical protein AB1657_03795 [Candidatus Micrarchaeota archaeon]